MAKAVREERSEGHKEAGKKSVCRQPIYKYQPNFKRWRRRRRRPGRPGRAAASLPTRATTEVVRESEKEQRMKEKEKKKVKEEEEDNNRSTNYIHATTYFSFLYNPPIHQIIECVWTMRRRQV